MGGFDLLFLLTVLVVLLGLAALVVSLVARRRRVARALALALAAWLLVYALALVGASLLSPARLLAAGERRCYDDWCIAVQSASARERIGDTRPNGRFVLVTVEVSNAARRSSQREWAVGLALLGPDGSRLAPSPAGQRALALEGGAGLPLDTLMDPLGRFKHVAVFEVPAETRAVDVTVQHGAFPGIVIIGDEQSLLHRPTYTHLNLTP